MATKSRTAADALRKMRAICLSLPGASEAAHHGGVVFKASRKIFASCGERNGVCRIVVQLEPDHATKMVACDPRWQRVYDRLKDCVMVNAADVENWDEIRELVMESYHLNAPPKGAGKKAPKHG